MNDYDVNYKSTPSPFFTNATVMIHGTSHQICVRGTSAADMTAKYFAAIETLTAAYAQRNPCMDIDASQLLALLQCGMEKARKVGDMGRMARLVKAAALVQNRMVTLAEDGFVVRSQEDAATTYAVNAALACTCEDWIRHADTTEKYYCKHGLAAMMLTKLMATMEA